MQFIESKWDPLTRFATITYAILFSLDGAFMFHAQGSANTFYMGILITCAILSTAILLRNNPKSGYLFICAFTLMLASAFWCKYTTYFIFSPMGFMFMTSITTFSICALAWMKEKETI